MARIAPEKVVAEWSVYQDGLITGTVLIGLFAVASFAAGILAVTSAKFLFSIPWFSFGIFLVWTLKSEVQKSKQRPTLLLFLDRLEIIHETEERSVSMNQIAKIAGTSKEVEEEYRLFEIRLVDGEVIQLPNSIHGTKLLRELSKLSGVPVTDVYGYRLFDPGEGTEFQRRDRE